MTVLHLGAWAPFNNAWSPVRCLSSCVSPPSSHPSSPPYIPLLRSSKVWASPTFWSLNVLLPLPVNPSFTSFAWLNHPLGPTFFEKSSLTSFLILVCPAAQAKCDINLCFCRLPCFLCCNTYPVFHQILNSIMLTYVCSVFSVRLDTAQVLISLANICWIVS